MRIIGGAWRGRALSPVGQGDAAAHLRPTTDRIRETLFNVLSGGRYGDPITGAHVLDVFAGTGALGLEALSRGAEAAIFLENGRKAQSLLRRNFQICEAGDRARLVPRDACKPGPALERPATLVFLDPPYGKGLGERALAELLSRGWIAEDALILWEESKAVAPPTGVQLLETRKMGGTQMNFLRVAVLDG